MGFTWEWDITFVQTLNPCLLAIKGRMPVRDSRREKPIVCACWQSFPKPDEQYNKIGEVYPGMNYLELFARRRRRRVGHIWKSSGRVYLLPQGVVHAS